MTASSSPSSSLSSSSSPGEVVASGSTAAGETVVLRTLAAGEEPPRAEGDPWDEWGERLPLAETAGHIERLVIEVGGEVVGNLSWHRTHYGPNAGSLAWNLGVELLQPARGRGIGTVAQRLLAEYLFRTTDLWRVEASTDVENVAEQRSLEKAGFTREGILRGAQYRADGVHHDLVAYSLLRSDLADLDDLAR